jgi:hypothetical protein
MKKRLFFAGTLVVVLIASASFALGKSLSPNGSTSEPQDKRTVPILVPHLSGPITLDGASGEPAWQAVTPFVMVQHSPNFGSPPTERTEVLVGFDDEFLYVAHVSSTVKRTRSRPTRRKETP